MTLKQWLCSLRGDHGLLRVENGRVYLACAACGWESNGVTVTPEGGDRQATARASVNRLDDRYKMLLYRSRQRSNLLSRLKVVSR